MCPCFIPVIPLLSYIYSWRSFSGLCLDPGPTVNPQSSPMPNTLTTLRCRVHGSTTEPAPTTKREKLDYRPLVCMIRSQKTHPDHPKFQRILMWSLRMCLERVPRAKGSSRRGGRGGKRWHLAVQVRGFWGVGLRFHLGSNA